MKKGETIQEMEKGTIDIRFTDNDTKGTAEMRLSKKQVVILRRTAQKEGKNIFTFLREGIVSSFGISVESQAREEFKDKLIEASFEPDSAERIADMAFPKDKK